MKTMFRLVPYLHVAFVCCCLSDSLCHSVEHIFFEIQYQFFIFSAFTTSTNHHASTPDLHQPPCKYTRPPSTIVHVHQTSINHRTCTSDLHQPSYMYIRPPPSTHKSYGHIPPKITLVHFEPPCLHTGSLRVANKILSERRKQK